MISSIRIAAVTALLIVITKETREMTVSLRMHFDAARALHMLPERIATSSRDVVTLSSPPPLKPPVELL